MKHARPLKKATCLLCAAMLAAGYGGIDVARAFGETLEPGTTPSAIEGTSLADEGLEKAMASEEEACAVNALSSPGPVSSVEADIPIDEARFPDANFRAFVKEIAGGDMLTQAVIDATTKLDLSSRGIADLTGIEYFTELEWIDFSENPLTSIDLSKNTKLKSGGSDGQIVSIPVAGDSVDLKDIDPNFDPDKAGDVEGATMTGSVLSGFAVGTMVSYSYLTGMKTNSGELSMIVILELMGASDLAITTDEAQPVPADEFQVADDGTLVVKGSGAYIIRMATYVETASEDRIVIAKGASPTITLDSLTLNSTEDSSIDIRPGAGDVTLYVQDYVRLKPQRPGAGILKNNGDASLTILPHPHFPGEGILEAVGCGEGYPGIGASGVGEQGKVTSCQNIDLRGLDVTAAGSRFAAGIGGGFGITEVSGISLMCDGKATGGENAAGIGSGWVQEGDVAVSDIHLESSEMEATGGANAAGIGSGVNEKGAATVSGIGIRDSTVTAKASRMSTGIGAGACKKGAIAVSDIAIANSKVTAIGDKSGAGIGSSWAYGDNAVSSIAISDSEVQATSLIGAPGIGSGYSDTGNSTLAHLTIADSEVLAGGGASEAVDGGFIGGGAGIGSGYSDKGDSTASDIVVSGSSNVQAVAGDDVADAGGAAGIGSGPAPAGTSSAQGIVLQGGLVGAWGGSTTASGLGPQTLPAVGAGSGGARTSSGNAIEPAEGMWASAWKGDSQDGLYPDGLFADHERERTSLDETCERGLIAAVWQAEMLMCSGTDDGYRYDKGLLVIEGDGTYTVGMSEPSEHAAESLAESLGADDAAGAFASVRAAYFEPASLGIVVAEGAFPTVVLDGVAVDVSDEDGRCAFSIEEDAGDTTVLLSGDNVLKSGDGRAGIEKNNGDAKLTVSSASGDGSTDGSLEALGGDGAAGIGGGKVDTGDSNAANIEIAGGTVRAVAGHTSARGRSAAGIGGGSTTGASGNADARHITVSGGNVYAKGSSSNSGAGAGIGGGTPRSGGHANASGILVSGGSVEATGGRNGGAGIGSGSSISFGESVAENIAIAGGDVKATGGNNAAGIGSGNARGEGNESRAENISVSGGTVTATAGTLGGAAGIGSGQTDGGPSIARSITISGGTVEAAGATGYFEGLDLYAIMGGAGIGSGSAGPAGTTGSGDQAVESRAENITVSGGSVHATGGSNSPGIGSGTAATDYTFCGSSTASGIRLTGGAVTAVGGLTHARESDEPAASGQIDSAELIGDMVRLPAVGAGLAVSRTYEDASIAPAANLMANAWKGSSAESAEQFLAESTEATSLADVQDAYLRAEFAARPDADPATPSEGGGAQDANDANNQGGGMPLASTGDGLMLLAAIVASIALVAAGAALVARKFTVD